MPSASQLLTPNSPSTNPPTHSRAPHLESPLKNFTSGTSSIRMLAGPSSHNTRSPQQGSIEDQISRRTGFSRVTSGYSTRDITPPASSPLGPSPSQMGSPASFLDDRSSQSTTPRVLFPTSHESPRLEPALDIIPRSRDTSRSHTPKAGFMKPTNHAQNGLRSPSPGLLPAFGDSPVGAGSSYSRSRAITPKSYKRPSSHDPDESQDTASPHYQSLRSRKTSRIDAPLPPEDVVDDIFRMETLHGIGASFHVGKEQSTRNSPQPQASYRRISGRSEPRPVKSNLQYQREAEPVEFLKRSNSPRNPPNARRGKLASGTPASNNRQTPTSSSNIAFSPVKGRRIQLMRPSSPSNQNVSDARVAVPSTSKREAPSLAATTAISSTGHISSVNHASTSTPQRPHTFLSSATQSLPQTRTAPPYTATLTKWLQSTPMTPVHEQPQLTDAQRAEREVRKKRRLAAFLDEVYPTSLTSRHAHTISSSPFKFTSLIAPPASPSPSKKRAIEHKSPLKAVVVKGMGRVAIHPKDIVEEIITPAKSKKPSPKKRGGKKGAAATPRKKATVFGIEVKPDNLAKAKEKGKAKEIIDVPDESAETGALDDDASSLGDLPDWLDNEYPWSEAARISQPKQLSPAEKLRIQQLEQFFDRITDDEDEGLDDDGEEHLARKGDLNLLDPSPDELSPGQIRARPHSAVSQQPTTLFSRDESGDARAAFAQQQQYSTRPKTTRTTSLDIVAMESSSSVIAGAVIEDAEIDDTSMKEEDTTYDPPYVAPQPSTQQPVGVHKRSKTPELLASVEIRPSPGSEGPVINDDDDDDDDEGIINCLCGQEHIDSAMVRCDSCRTWSHLPCIGIENEDQLGAEWFCFNCEQRMIAEHQNSEDDLEPDVKMEDPPVSQEPMFTMTSESPQPRALGDLKFYDAPLTSSPLYPYSNSARAGSSLQKVPSTPKTSNAPKSSGFFTPFANNSLGSYTTSITPRTPNAQFRSFDMRSYATPKFFSNSDPSSSQGANTSEAFDPNSTPSRGIKFGTPFQNSIASDRSWALGNIPTTPTRSLGIPNLNSIFGSAGGRLRSGSNGRRWTYHPPDPIFASPMPMGRANVSEGPLMFPRTPLFRRSTNVEPPSNHGVSNESAVRGNIGEDEDVL